MRNTYETLGDVTIIHLQNRHGIALQTLIDTEDLQKVMSFPNSWYAQQPDTNHYVCGNRQGSLVKLHRYIMSAPKGLMVDHINGNTLDNRKNNLRIVTSSENQQNRRGAQRNSKSGVRGVCWHKQRGKWTTRIRINGQRIYLGLYDSLSDAEKAVIDARQKYMTHSVG